MKQQFKYLTLLLLALVLAQCNSSNNITITHYAGDSLDLKAVSNAAAKSKNAEEFEKLLNTTGNKINNLDLNEDGKIDYIKVTEINEGTMKGFSLTVDVSANEEQEICTIQFEKTSNSSTRIQTHGNSHIYGHNSYYHYSSPISSMIMYHYIFSSHRPYHSRYGYRNYPNHFSSNSKPVSNAQYSSFHKSQPYANSYKKATSSQTKTQFKSPNASKVASNIKAPLRNPSTSQKSFQKSNPSKNVRTSSSSRFGSSSSSRSRSSFGGGK